MPFLNFIACSTSLAQLGI